MLNHLTNSKAYWETVRRNKKILKRLPEKRKTRVSTQDNTIPSIDIGICSNLSVDSLEKSREDSLVESTSELNGAPSQNEGENCEVGSLRTSLEEWALMYNIRHTALKDLLFVLNPHVPQANLPKDPRTLLSTPQSIIICSIGDGHYWHQGLEFCLRQYFDTFTGNRTISLNFNIDGLPLYNSSPIQFWPILFNINEIKNFKPMVIGIYCGKGKPSDLYAYLSPFVKECKKIIEDGVVIGNNHIKVKIRSFICDSPARAFIKGVTYFNGKHGCLKCTVVGEYIDHRTVFLGTNCPRRTNEGFRRRSYGLHHKQTSPLEELPVDMVEDFPVGDVHLIDLGVMKRTLTGWVHGGHFKGSPIRLCSNDIRKLSEELINFKVPREMHRTTRSLDCLAFWKGTEFRTFLLYAGMVFLKDILRYDAYEHFICLVCAITICSSQKYNQFLPLANELLCFYIQKYEELYQKRSITSNVHNLCHLVDEVKKFGVLETFSSYPFENILSSLKNLLRTGSNPLAQAAKRISELSRAERFQERKIIYPILKNQNEDGSYSKLVFQNFTLSNDMPNKWFLTKDQQIICFEKALNTSNSISIKGHPLKEKNNFFLTPIKSSHLNIFFSKCEENDISLIKINNIKCKMVAVPYNNDGIVFLPLLHSL